MVRKLETTIILLSKIRVSRSRLRCRNIAAKRQAMQAIRRDGQPRPLIIDPNGKLLADTALYLALKELRYDFVKVLKLANPSPALVRQIGRLLDRHEALRREATAFNAVLTSLDGIPEAGTEHLVLSLFSVVRADTGERSIRLLPMLVSDEGRRRPLDL